MFLNKLIQRNPKLIECAFDMHQKGMITPDTYILDYDAIIENAKIIKQQADECGIDLYFMLKQIGRNPVIAKALIVLGYPGAVTVDYKEALLMIENGIHICNVGHLVQIPDVLMDTIISSDIDYVTVYSLEFIQKIDECARKLGKKQSLLIRMCDYDSDLYSGQVGGFKSEEVEKLIKEIETMDNVSLGGFTIFPGLLFDDKQEKIVSTSNIKALNRAINIAKSLGFDNLNINIPSATCFASIPLIKELSGKSGEPGHGLTGTTPLHCCSDQPEIPAYVYVSEISHSYNDNSYCYGGGYYRRGHMQNVLIGQSLNDSRMTELIAPELDSIDYHYEIKGKYDRGLCALMAYRTQIFVTRSNVAVVKGIQSGNPELIGLYDSQGKKLEDLQ